VTGRFLYYITISKQAIPFWISVSNFMLQRLL